MNLKQLEAFVQVAEGGSFSKAAKQLFLTQPTISAHISSLEKELNARFFVRNTKEVKLSDDGKELYRYARQMIDLQKKIEERFETGKSESKHGSAEIWPGYVYLGKCQRHRQRKRTFCHQTKRCGL